MSFSTINQSGLRMVRALPQPDAHAHGQAWHTHQQVRWLPCRAAFTDPVGWLAGWLAEVYGRFQMHLRLWSLMAGVFGWLGV